MDDQQLTSRETASLLKVRMGTLAAWRCRKRYGIPFIKIGRLIRYRRSDIEAFLQTMTVRQAGEGVVR